MSRITFTLLKPDSVRKGNIGAILDKIIKTGSRAKKTSAGYNLTNLFVLVAIPEI